MGEGAAGGYRVQHLEMDIALEGLTVLRREIVVIFS